MILNRLAGYSPIRKEAQGERNWADLIDTLAEGFEPALARAFRAAASDLGSAASIRALAAAIEAGDLNAIYALMDVAPETPGFQALLPILNQVAQAAGTAAAAAAPAALGTIHFNLLNPRTSEFIASYGLNLISKITQEVREGIREALRFGLENGKNPYATAREIKKVANFGLTAQQARAVGNFRKELETLDAAALKQMLAGGARKLRDKRYDPTIKAALAGKKSLNQEQIDKMVERYRERLLAHRAATIARTESLRAANAGAHEAMLQGAEQSKIAESAFVRRWIIARDERTCPVCRQIPKLNPKGVGMREPFVTPYGATLLPPQHVNCLSGDTLVASGSRIAGVSKRWYEGDVVVVSVAGQDDLTITPNHPVLTAGGWVAAGFLKEGDYVVRSARPDWAAGGVYHEHGMPSRIREIAKAFHLARAAPAVEVPVAPPHFHGDGGGSQVAVVWSDRMLAGAYDAAHGQESMQRILTMGRAEHPLLAGSGHLQQRFEGALATTDCGMCGSDLGGPRIWSHPGPFDALLLPPGPSLLTQPLQGAFDGGSADTELARQIHDGLTGPVALAKVVGVRRHPFRNHVYNLHTALSHYYANGVVVHNCRCTVTHRIRAEAIDAAMDAAA